ncbi:MAG: hypothetical protein IT366_11770 [Candidatus Hydrogenedentes bacterium]|nr:hypothetical protein [Candidatus Hydrogenedentota bacterium]
MNKDLKKYAQRAANLLAAIFCVSILILIPYYFLSEGRSKLFYSSRYGQVLPGIAIGYLAITVEVLLLGLAVFTGVRWLRDRGKHTARKR